MKIYIRNAANWEIFTIKSPWPRATPVKKIGPPRVQLSRHFMFSGITRLLWVFWTGVKDFLCNFLSRAVSSPVGEEN